MASGYRLANQSEGVGVDKVLDGVCKVLWVSKVKGGGHGLRAKGVVIHFQGREDDGVVPLFRQPPGGRLDGVHHL